MNNTTDSDLIGYVVLVLTVVILAYFLAHGLAGIVQGLLEKAVRV